MLTAKSLTRLRGSGLRFCCVHKRYGTFMPCNSPTICNGFNCDLKTMAVFVLLMFYFNILLCCDAEFTVSTKAGVFKGLIRDLDVYGKAKQVGKFLGIPYAESPVGNRRFQKPVLKAPMTSIYDATKYGASCLQLEINL